MTIMPPMGSQIPEGALSWGLHQSSSKIRREMCCTLEIMELEHICVGVAFVVKLGVLGVVYMCCSAVNQVHPQSESVVLQTYSVTSSNFHRKQKSSMEIGCTSCLICRRLTSFLNRRSFVSFESLTNSIHFSIPPPPQWGNYFSPGVLNSQSLNSSLSSLVGLLNS